MSRLAFWTNWKKNLKSCRSKVGSFSKNAHAAFRHARFFLEGLLLGETKRREEHFSVALPDVQEEGKISYCSS